MRNNQYYVLGSELKRLIARERYDKPMLRRRDGKLQPLGDSLVVLFKNQFNRKRPTNPLISVPVSLGQMSTFLRGKSAGLRHDPDRRYPSVFERFDLRDASGKPISFRSHDFRRLLNVYAQRGGLT